MPALLIIFNIHIHLQIHGVKHIFKEIGNASQNQKGVLEQITTNVDSISNVVQSNSSFAQNSAATSAELSDQSKRLHELVNRFHLKKK